MHQDHLLRERQRLVLAAGQAGFLVRSGETFVSGELDWRTVVKGEMYAFLCRWQFTPTAQCWHRGDRHPHNMTFPALFRSLVTQLPYSASFRGDEVDGKRQRPIRAQTLERNTP
jgi:hypothetical protein